MMYINPAILEDTCEGISVSLIQHPDAGAQKDLRIVSVIADWLVSLVRAACSARSRRLLADIPHAETINFRSIDELEKYFETNGIFVGPRSGKERRTQEQKEVFKLRQYLVPVARSKLIPFPIIVAKFESPDFLIISGCEISGLEVTEATEKSYQRELTETEKEIKRIESDENASIAELLSGDGWVGDNPEREACAAILRAMRRKARKIRSGHYRKVDRYDLLIYVNIRAFFYDFQTALNILEKRINQYPNQWAGLGRVSIIGPGQLCFDAINSNIVLPLPEQN